MGVISIVIGDYKITYKFLVGGWATPLKNRKINWDDEIPNIWENFKWQPNHQPVMSVQFLDYVGSMFF